MFDEGEARTLVDLSASHTYDVRTSYDALNRVVKTATPDGTDQAFMYNEANLLQKVVVTQNGAARTFVHNIDYNERGQRTKIEYGNGIVTDHTYDPNTFRLETLNTVRSGSQSPKKLQQLAYTYDPVGNIAEIRDDAHALIFNHNDKIEPVSKYTYDPIYRLIEATGREHENMTACHSSTHAKKHTEFIRLTTQSISNGQALCNYVEKYVYDKSGNIELFDHWNRTLNQHWKRLQNYESGSNRIRTSGAVNIEHDPNTGKVIGSPPACSNEDRTIPHDDNGNIEQLPHLPEMKWDFRNQLCEVQLNVGTNPNKAFYQYDAAGQRVRKTVVKNGTIQERIYLGGVEIYTERNGSGYQQRRDTIHVMDDKNRIALIEDEKNPASGTDSQGNSVDSRIRYQLSNHLGSAVLELDGTVEAKIISYEEYYAYGGSAYLASRNDTEASGKRYRYSGKERDDETGFYYYGARYYAPWLGRWTVADPAGLIDGPNLYVYAKNRPINMIDTTGLAASPFFKMSKNEMSTSSIEEMTSDKEGGGDKEKKDPKAPITAEDNGFDFEGKGGWQPEPSELGSSDNPITAEDNGFDFKGKGGWQPEPGELGSSDNPITAGDNGFDFKGEDGWQLEPGELGSPDNPITAGPPSEDNSHIGLSDIDTAVAVVSGLASLVGGFGSATAAAVPASAVGVGAATYYFTRVADEALGEAAFGESGGFYGSIFFRMAVFFGW